MECALLGRPGTEEAEDDIAHPADLCRPRRAGGVWDAGTNDAGRTEKAALHVSQMHGAAEPFAQPVDAPVDLRHHGFGIAAENQRVAVAAIGREGRIAFTEMAE